MWEGIALWLVRVLVAVGEKLIPLWFQHQALMHLALREATDEDRERVADALADGYRRLREHPPGDPGPKPAP